MRQSSRDLIGTTLGICTLEQLLGAGAVYLARQQRPARYVAVKVLLPNVVLTSQMQGHYLARFRREADIIARLEHVNIVPIYEYGEQDGLAYLVMPYLSGGSLYDALVQRGTIPLMETIQYLHQAADALDHAHAHHVIHRDLKPANFLLHIDGGLLLSDFGIARIMQDELRAPAVSLTGTRTLLGTPHYLAPEFPPLLHQINPAIPPAVDAVVQKAIAKRQEDRFPSAKSMVLALAIAASSESRLADDISHTLTLPPAPLGGTPLSDEAMSLAPLSEYIGQASEGMLAKVAAKEIPPRPEPIWKVPSTPTSLSGREHGIAAIAALLRQPEVRLLTLLGPGGIGKTRLSIAVALSMRECFEAGICFVPLATISDTEPVLPTIDQELTIEHITQSAAVTLFVQRACSLPARQQTLRSTMQWSYDLLGPQEQALLPLLAVSAGGWTLEAAEALCQRTGQADLDVLNTLSAPLDNTLIHPSEQEAEEPRFPMLQTVREFGLERLAASGEREVAHQAHAAYYLALAQEAEPHLTHAVGIRRRPRNRRNLVEHVVWLERLELEYENLRAALQWAAAHGNEEMQLALRLSSGFLAFSTWAKESEQ